MLDGAAAGGFDLRQSPRRNGTEALVEKALQPGERVVVYPSDALRDGARVALTRKGQR